MAKGDIWYLKDKNDDDRIVAKIEFTDDYCTGDCYEPYSWYGDDTPAEWHYVACFYCKWDSCTHWWFRGENYDVEIDGSGDSYYHLCGTHCFTNHIRNMCFVWKVAAMTLVESHKRNYRDLAKDICRDYFDKNTTKLIELMLDGYVIEKEEKK